MCTRLFVFKIIENVLVVDLKTRKFTFKMFEIIECARLRVNLIKYATYIFCISMIVHVQRNEFVSDQIFNVQLRDECANA